MTVQILAGDCREILKTLPGESVHCIVTSPPYFGLRDYGTARWEGGDPTCDHFMPPLGGTVKSTLNLSTDAVGYTTGKTQPNKAQYPVYCAKCGARRIDSQIGLEQTPAAYVAELVSVFRECRRVLRDDGTLWLNLGDSYSSGQRKTTTIQTLRANQDASSTVARPPIIEGVKEKDLIGIPWRVALALQSDGGYLRQDIIWAKPNPMPESVRDRCTKAHEYVFMLSKRARYFYDADAIAEAATHAGQVLDYTGNQKNNDVDTKMQATRPKGRLIEVAATRNRRSVWTIPSEPFPEAHFATFPTALPELCIKAGCPKGGMVLDPFGGAGTVGLVADRLGRDAILIELNPDYAAMARSRITSDAPMFAEVVA